MASRVHSCRIQRVRDILVAGHVKLMWAKRRLFCDEALCSRKRFSESTRRCRGLPVPRHG
nr:hypothetical protein [Arthrobacter polaris]